MGRKSDAKDRIINSAQSLIYARSYADVGVQEICDAANVKKGSFYHFFPSKSDLTIAMLDHLWQGFEQDLLKPAFAPDLPPLQRFQRFYSALVAFQEKLTEENGHLLGCPYGNLALELSTQNEPIRLKIKQIFQQTSQYFEASLIDAIATGDSNCVDPGIIGKALFAMIEGAMMFAKADNNPDTLQQLKPAFFQLLCPTAKSEFSCL